MSPTLRSCIGAGFAKQQTPAGVFSEEHSDSTHHAHLGADFNKPLAPFGKNNFAVESLQRHGFWPGGFQRGGLGDSLRKLSLDAPVSLLLRAPYEILMLVVDNIPELKDLNALARVSNYMYQALNGTLYKRGMDPSAPPVREYLQVISHPEWLVRWAMLRGLTRTIGLMLGATHEPILPNGNWGTSNLMKEAVCMGQPAVIRFLLAWGIPVDCDVEGKVKLTPLHVACCGVVKFPVVETLLECGANVNGCTTDGWTPLHYAAGSQLVATIQHLIVNGANIDARNSDGNTPLLVAAKTGRVEVVGMLLWGGADINVVNKAGETALYWAARRCSADLVILYVNAGADINIRTRQQIPLQVFWEVYKDDRNRISVGDFLRISRRLRGIPC